MDTISIRQVTIIRFPYGNLRLVDCLTPQESPRFIYEFEALCEYISNIYSSASNLCAVFQGLPLNSVYYG